MAETGILQREVELSLHKTLRLLDVSIQPYTAQTHLSQNNQAISPSCYKPLTAFGVLPVRTLQSNPRSNTSAALKTIA